MLTVSIIHVLQLPNDRFVVRFKPEGSELAHSKHLQKAEGKHTNYALPTAPSTNFYRRLRVSINAHPSTPSKNS